MSSAGITSGLCYNVKLHVTDNVLVTVNYVAVQTSFLAVPLYNIVKLEYELGDP